MARPPRPDRSTIAAATLTLRLTDEDRELLAKLVALQTHELSGEGIVPTAASYVRGLIRREAAAKGFLGGRSKSGTEDGARSVPRRPRRG